MNYQGKQKRIILKRSSIHVILLCCLITRVSIIDGYASNISEKSNLTAPATNYISANLLECTAPGATAAVSGSITCRNPNVTLNGSSPTTGATFTWTGPEGFSSGAQNPVIYLPGTYYLTVTSPAGGCTSTASVVVLRDTVQPSANASVSAIINCTTPSVRLQASTNVTGATFWWIGPGSYTSSQQNPSVTTSGGYTLVVTNPVNGCASTATTYAEKNTTLPLASAYVSGTLTCVQNAVQLTSSSPTSGVTFSWSGPNGFSASTQNTAGSISGTYTLTVTNPANTCKSIASVNLIQDIVNPGAEITSSASVLTCNTINATLYGSSPAVGVTYSWIGPAGFSSDVQNPVVAAAGDYILATTKASNGCVSSDTFSLGVNKIKPGATALPSGQLNCANSSITLQGSSTSQSVSFKWIGPASFGSSTIQNPSTSYKGGYILTTTDLNNGCQSQAVASVVENKTVPGAISAIVDGPLTCLAGSINITGNSSTAGVTYGWNGPGYSSSGKVASVATPGTYILTVTHPVSFCKATTSAVVIQNSSKPIAVSAGNAGPLTCSTLSTSLSGNSATNGVIYKWTGPGSFTSNIQNPTVNQPGTYRLTVTNNDNGCKDSAITIVAQDLSRPEAVIATNGGPLTCSVTSVNITGSSSTEGVTYKWSGPGGFTSTSKNPTVNSAGSYKLIITNSVNGCKDSTTTLIVENVTEPGVTASVADVITCNIRSVEMNANSPTNGVIYDWSGPDDFTSTEQNPTTNKPGPYTVIARDPSNNCTSTYLVTVAHDTIAPENVTALVPRLITCDHTTVELQGNSTTEDVNYLWTGPNGFSSPDQNTLTSAAGNYILSVTNFLNGCAKEVSVQVNQNTVKPADVSATASGILNCLNNTVTLTGSSSTNGVTYNWSGPGVASSTSVVTASVSGTYFLTVTDPANGCLETKNIVVGRNVTVPSNVTTSVDTVLTCKRNEVMISATSTTGDVEYAWSGPNGFVSNIRTPMVSSPGVYTVTVTYTPSGCSALPKTINVIQNIAPPANVTATVTGSLSCDIQAVSLTGTSSTSGTYNWIGPDGYTSSMQNPIIQQGGKYILTVTATNNGCSAKDSVTVDEDFTPPADITASVLGPINCNNTFAILEGYSSTDGAGFQWTGPNLDMMSAMAFTNEPGQFTLTVTNPLNGCTVQRTVTVLDSTIYPVCSISVPDNTVVEELTINTISTFYSSKYAYDWTIESPAWQEISGDNTYVLTYKAGNANSSSDISVLVTDNSNGCESSCSVNLRAAVSAVKSSLNGSNLLNSSEDKANDLLLKAYPVPSIGKVFLVFESPEQTNASLKVYNSNGTLVASLFNGTVEANQSYYFTFNETENLPAGTYIYILKANNKSNTGKIILE